MKPKYIAGLMKAAAKRRMENEKVQERKIQKEREMEGDLWGDKEVFVTSAYRQKMEERQRLEEEERNQERIEELLDVRKQKDLSGFYDQLLKMKSGEIVIEEEGAKQKRLEIELAEAEKAKQEKEKSTSVAHQKNYRSKKEEESSSESESDQEEIIQVKEEKQKVEIEKPSEPANKESEFKEPLPKKIKSEEEQEKAEAKTEPAKPKLSKEEARKQRLIEIYTKRTVGEKFEQELNDYFIRKAKNLSIKSYIERE